MRYFQEINKTHKELQRLCPALISPKGSVLLHDNAGPQKLNELSCETLPYSPDSSATDYHFSNISTTCKRRTPEFYATGINKLVTCRQQY
uniref:Uncharacterized protein n=1 Tax=Heterorhabditis bacteriophora TaxID=37862 RepID=A0A1I7XUQ5_HETBA